MLVGPDARYACMYVRQGKTLQGCLEITCYSVICSIHKRNRGQHAIVCEGETHQSVINQGTSAAVNI